MAVVKQQKLPYAGAGAIDRFFAAIRTIRDPGKIDADWTASNKVGEGVAVPSMLRFLGVLNEDMKPVSSELWQNLRLLDTRQATLRELVESAYGDLFSALDVGDATREGMRTAFERIYHLGNASNRITTFLKLSELAGIPLKALEAPIGKVPVRETKAGTTPPPKPPTPKPATQSTKREDKVKTPAGAAVDVTISLAVEIPAAWDEGQIKERVQAVIRAAREVVHVDRT